MPSFCAVPNCTDRYGHSERISFHKFPLKRLDLLKQWEAFIQKQRGPQWQASRWTSLCSRHFRDDDFRSLNERKILKKTAVPTIFDEDTQQRSSTPDVGDKQTSNKESAKEMEQKEIMAIKERLEVAVEDVGSISKSYCRLCGHFKWSAASFLTNFELYGIIQKCFPTLNIQQQDALPKSLCNGCLKDVDKFGIFVDNVLRVQTELQRKFRSRMVEKPLKIKQEPLGVRVKQEIAETGYEETHDSVLNPNEDYEHGNDEGVDGTGDCDENVDQKFVFSDFPILNDCDIMEIINLDDPFIDIPDDDNTTTVANQPANEQLLQKQTSQNDRNYGINQQNLMGYVPSAHELLQSHLLIEEHNYACTDTTEEFKEERQIYKTEKSENDETYLQQQMPASTLVNSGQQEYHHQNNNNSNVYITHPPATAASSLSQVPCTMDNIQTHNINSNNRAIKPIVTSVSAIQQPSKPGNGIVVLNESIVQSGCGFQLHACMVCHLKYFSIESLRQHYTQTHGTPMISIPSSNLNYIERPTIERPCKMENEVLENTTEKAIAVSSGITTPQQSQQQHVHNNAQYNGIASKTMQENYENGRVKNVPETFENLRSKTMPEISENITIKGVPLQKIPPISVQATSNYILEHQQQQQQFSIAQTNLPATINENKAQKETAEISSQHTEMETKNLSQLRAKKKKIAQKLKSLNRNSTAFRKTQSFNMNLMVNQYQQLKKLCQQLQKQCFSLEQNVEQLQQQPEKVIVKTLPVRQRRRRQQQSYTNNEFIQKTYQNAKTHNKHSIRNEQLDINENISPTAASSLSLQSKQLLATCFACELCPKTFPNLNSLRQHNITHTDEKSHVCTFCPRSFKRRNGLLQHLRGYHMEMKPFQCPICQRGFALKCDMLRCKHTILKGSRTKKSQNQKLDKT